MYKKSNAFPTSKVILQYCYFYTGSKEKIGKISIIPVLLQTFSDWDLRVMFKKMQTVNTKEYTGIPLWE